MKRIISKILLIIILASSIIPHGIIDTSHAQTNSWDFSIPGDYIVSDSSKIDIANGLGSLIYTMTHQSSISNGGSVLLDGAYAIDIDGNYAYISANKSNAIEIVDISNPLNPTHAGSISNGDGGALLEKPKDLIKSGNYLYVISDRSKALEIIDVSDPYLPTHVSSITDGGTTYLDGANGIYKVGDLLYIAVNKDDALEIINIANPLNPTHVGSINSNKLDGAQNVIVKGNYAFVTCDRSDSLQVINISNPSNPSLVGELANGDGGALLDGARGIEISGDYAFITSDKLDAIEIVDISNPLNPTHASSISNGGTTLLDGPANIEIDGNLAYVSSKNSNAIEVIDISNPLVPTHLSNIVNGGTVLLEKVINLKKNGNLIYAVSDRSKALEIIKVGFPDDSPYIEPISSQTYKGTISNITETLGSNNTGNITYQLSKNGGTTWYYFDGNSWVTTTAGPTQSSSITQINTNIGSFNDIVGINDFKWKAFLNSDGSQKVEIDMIELETITPNSIVNGVFHFDGMDINGNGNYADEPVNESYVTNWVDKFNSNNAIQAITTNAPIYANNKITSHSGVVYQGDDDYQTITNNIDINTGTFDEKSFAIIFKTGDDTSSFQNIYEQGDGTGGYAIQIENNQLYAGVWNNVDWLVGDQYKVISIPNIKKNTEYRLIMVQDSTNALLGNRTIQVFLDGTQMGILNNVDIQTNHGGGIGLGAVNTSTRKLSDLSNVGVSAYFNGNIGELISWNHALSQKEIDSMDEYLYEKWVKSGPIINYLYPKEIGVIQAGNFDIEIYYDDGDFGNLVDINSDKIELYRWNGSGWGTDVSSTYINTGGKTISNFEVLYPVNSIIEGKYKLIFSIANINGISSNKELLFNVGETIPNTLSNIIFHYDAQDTNGDGILNNEGNINGDTIGTLVDKVNSFDAYQTIPSQIPIFESNSINSYDSIKFSPNQIYNIDNQGIINTNATFQEKSFATVFKTGDDVNTFQTIFEEGGNIRGYSFVVHNGHVYAGVWNLNEWDIGHQFKSVDMGVALPNTVYFGMIIQSSTSNLHSENTLEFYLNGNLTQRQEHVEQQYNHPGKIAIGGVLNDTVRASDGLPISITEGHHFDGNVGELISWNHSLDRAEINGIQEYFSKKWGIVMFFEKYPIPDPTSELNPTYKFITNTEGTLIYGGSCKSITTNAYLGENTINFDIDGIGGSMPNGIYDDCIITLRDINGFDHVLNVTPFTIESSTYTLIEVIPIPLYSDNHFPEYTFDTPISGNIEYYGWCNSNSSIASVGNNTIILNYLPSGNYSTCYLRVVNSNDTSEFLNISEFNINDDGPVLDSKSLIDNNLYPTGILDFDYTYHDTSGNGIDLLSESIELYKYNSSSGSYGSDIASSYISNNSVSQTLATYSATNIPFGKYKVIFTIISNSGTPMVVETIIYIDEPELNVSTGSVNMGTLSTASNTFSPEIIISVKTLGAGFDLILNKTTDMENIYGDKIINWDGSKGIGYDNDPYSNSISFINTDEILISQGGSINTFGDKNEYIYRLKIGSLIDAEQSAGNYQTNLGFGVNFDY